MVNYGNSFPKDNYGLLREFVSKITKPFVSKYNSI